MSIMSSVYDLSMGMPTSELIYDILQMLGCSQVSD
jgi:hypothetical protein